MTSLLKYLVTIVFCFFISCTEIRDCKYGFRYNSIRKEFKAIVIGNSMIPESCMEDWTRYKRSDIPADNVPFHASKTIWQTQDNSVVQEQDIYRMVINDTALVELQVFSYYNWPSKTVTLSGHIGITDKRFIYLTTGNKVQEQLKYPDYKSISLNESQIDSVLNSWAMAKRTN